MSQEFIDIRQSISTSMIGYTTEDISDIVNVKNFCDELKILVDDQDMYVHWLSAEEAVHCERYDQLSDDRLKKIYSRGGIAICNKNNSLFYGGLTWNRISKVKAKKFLKEVGYRQNEVGLRVHADSVKNESFRKRFRTFVKNVAIHLNVTYLYVYNPLKQDGAFCSQNGLGVGLKDIYWINIFGKPYLRMIGKEKLLKCPVGHVEDCGQDHVLIQTADLPLDIDHNDDRRMVEHIRDYIGCQYFTKIIEKKHNEKSGVISIWEFICFLWRTRKDHIDTGYQADVRPEFEWKNIFLDE